MGWNVEQLEDGGASVRGGSLTDTPRYPSISFGHTVGEMSGELQHPPESHRRGRKCMLTLWAVLDDSEFDEVAQMFVTYLGPRPAPEEWREDELIGRIMSYWRPFYPASDDVQMDEWRDEVQSAFDDVVKAMEEE